MTEADWLTSDDPVAMLDYLALHQPSDRKLRLFACACYLTHAQDTGEGEAVRLAEAWADSGIPVVRREPRFWSVLAYDAAWAAHNQAEDSRIGSDPHRRVVTAALLREIVGNPFRPVTLPGEDHEWEQPFNRMAFCRRCGVEYASDAHRASLTCPPTRSWLTPTVLGIAQEAYDERLPDGTLDPDRLLILSDALEEAGCDNPHCIHCVNGVWGEFEDGAAIPCHCTTTHILNHLRSPGPHVRGCWVLDLLLGKE